MTTTDNHALDNAKGHLASIVGLYNAAQICENNLGDLVEDLDEDDRETLEEVFDEQGRILDTSETSDAILEEICEMAYEEALCVEVRSGWVSQHEAMGPEEFRITLTSGGPSFELVGELHDGEPTRPRLFYADQSTRRTEYIAGSRAALIWFASQFYFGE